MVTVTCVEVPARIIVGVAVAAPTLWLPAARANSVGLPDEVAGAGALVAWAAVVIGSASVDVVSVWTGVGSPMGATIGLAYSHTAPRLRKARITAPIIIRFMFLVKDSAEANQGEHPSSHEADGRRLRD